MDRYHINEDGTIPCTNECDKNVKWSTILDWWVHEDGVVGCHTTSLVGGEEACPLPPNDDPDEWTTPMKEKWSV